jgi:sulfonate transport system permease protein
MRSLVSAPVVDVGVRRRAVRAQQRVPRPFAAARQRLLSPLLIVVVWQVASSTGLLPERLLASPVRIVTTAADLIQAGILPEAIAISLQRTAIGFTLGALAGIGLALIAGLSRVGENTVDPPLQMLRALPLFGLIPLFILWFGIGETPKVALVALGVVFPLYLNTFAGIRGVDGKLGELAQVLRLRRSAMIVHLVLPGALPQTLVGLRQSLGVAWLALIVAEQINADAGLGYMINNAREFLRTDVIVVGLIVYAIFGLLTDSLVRLLERRALSWRQSFLSS